MTFALDDVQSDGTVLWSEPHDDELVNTVVDVQDGV